MQGKIFYSPLVLTIWEHDSEYVLIHTINEFITQNRSLYENFTTKINIIFEHEIGTLFEIAKLFVVLLQ